MPDYKSLADLKGKKIGVTAPGSSTNDDGQLRAGQGGLKPTDVSFIGVGAARRHHGRPSGQTPSPTSTR
jgi:NitT/TauT family transport system substrate-binding protein